MTQHSLDHLEKSLEQKTARRTKKKYPNMKVSGASVKKLQRIIINKSRD
jgi:hypothetical protein